MDKIDLVKMDKPYYAPSAREPGIVEVPAFNFLMVDGLGNPNNSPIYQDSVSSLFQAAYALKFAVKKGQGVDYGVLPLEGLWWIEGELEFTQENKSRWSWTMMIRQPDWVNAGLVEETFRVLAKKKDAPVRLADLRLERYDEGSAVQLMHIGPYAEEHENIMRMHAFARQQGYRLDGKHHEIYLSDVRKTAPERLRTVLRQPLRAN